MNSDPSGQEDFFEAGLGRYGRAVEVMRAFRERVQRLLSDVVEGFRFGGSPGQPKPSFAESEAEIYVRLEVEHPKKPLKLKVGLTWVGDKAFCYAGFDGRAPRAFTFHDLPGGIADSDSFPRAWGDRSLVSEAAKHDVASVSATFNSLLKELERQLESL
ncbi:MAG: hypothetical protein JST92_25690 [Deltaproteobacteria bacterium]|nr:hypothetical protein [Deltaproteobacteria bacterium]